MKKILLHTSLGLLIALLLFLGNSARFRKPASSPSVHLFETWTKMRHSRILEDLRQNPKGRRSLPLKFSLPYNRAAYVTTYSVAERADDPAAAEFLLKSGKNNTDHLQNLDRLWAKETLHAKGQEQFTEISFSDLNRSSSFGSDIVLAMQNLLREEYSRFYSPEQIESVIDGESKLDPERCFYVVIGDLENPYHKPLLILRAYDGSDLPDFKSSPPGLPIENKFSVTLPPGPKVQIGLLSKNSDLRSVREAFQLVGRWIEARHGSKSFPPIYGDALPFQRRLYKRDAYGFLEDPDANKGATFKAPWETSRIVKQSGEAYFKRFLVEP